MATKKNRTIHKHFQLDSIKLKRAQKVLAGRAAFDPSRSLHPEREWTVLLLQKVAPLTAGRIPYDRNLSLPCGRRTRSHKLGNTSARTLRVVLWVRGSRSEWL